MPDFSVEPPPSTDFLLGQITAQLKEMVHSQNNTNQAINGMESALTRQIADLAARVSALEAANQRREGASGLFKVFLQSPALGWIVGAAVTVYLYVTGKLSHP